MINTVVAEPSGRSLAVCQIRRFSPAVWSQYGHKSRLCRCLLRVTTARWAFNLISWTTQPGKENSGLREGRFDIRFGLVSVYIGKSSFFQLRQPPQRPAKVFCPGVEKKLQLMRIHGSVFTATSVSLWLLALRQKPSQHPRRSWCDSDQSVHMRRFLLEILIISGSFQDQPTVLGITDLIAPEWLFSWIMQRSHGRSFDPLPLSFWKTGEIYCRRPKTSCSLHQVRWLWWLYIGRCFCRPEFSTTQFGLAVKIKIRPTLHRIYQGAAIVGIRLHPCCLPTNASIFCNAGAGSTILFNIG